MTPDGTVSTLAGVPNDSGSVDGTGGSALFSYITGMTLDSHGNLIVLDGGANQTVRVVTPGGVVTTLAGKAGQTGTANGQGAAASFTDLMGVALDGQGNIYVSDGATIRMITPTGLVSLFAGTPGAVGYANGSLTAATFSGPQGLAFDANGNLYVAEWSDIRMIGTNGQTSTFAGAPLTAGMDVDGTGSAAIINSAAGLAALPNNAGFVFTESGSAVRRVTASGLVSTLAGKNGAGSIDTNGPELSATFSSPSAVASDASGNLYVATQGGLQHIDSQGNVSNISLPSQIATSILGIGVDAAGNVYLSCVCQQIFKVTSSGVVTVLAGQANVIGSADGAGSQATFNYPRGLAVDAGGNVFVADMANYTIRRIDPSGNVSTFAGKAGAPNGVDGQGTAARFWSPWGLAFDSQGNLYVSDWGADTIRKITPGGLVTTAGGVYFVAGVSSGSTTRFNLPTGIAIDSSDNLYVMNTGNSVIQRLSPNGLAYPMIGQPGVFALQPGVGGAININQNNGIAVLPNGQVVFTSELAVVGD